MRTFVKFKVKHQKIGGKEIFIQLSKGTTLPIFRGIIHKKRMNSATRKS